MKELTREQRKKIAQAIDVLYAIAEDGEVTKEQLECEHFLEVLLEGEHACEEEN